MNIAGIIIVVAIVAVAAIVVFALMKRRTEHLKEQFGPEYKRAVQESGNKYRAEAQLEKLEKEVKGFTLHPLAKEDAARFRDSWKTLQAMFVDDPNRALRDADRLISEVMATRGYPLSDFDKQAAQLSVDHSAVVEHYRAAHEVAARQERGGASTEEVRGALLHYRALFEELVVEPRVKTAGA
jgi:hypothetical protein